MAQTQEAKQAREEVRRMIANTGVSCAISSMFGEGTVFNVLLKPEWFLYTSVSCMEGTKKFYGLTVSVLDELEESEADYGVLFIDIENNCFCLLAKSDIPVLLEKCSASKNAKGKKIAFKLTDDTLVKLFKDRITNSAGLCELFIQMCSE